MEAGISSYPCTWAIGVPGSEPEKPMTVFELFETTKALEIKTSGVVSGDITILKAQSQNHKTSFLDQSHL